MHNNFNADEKILRYTEKLDRFFNSHKTLIVTELDLTNRCNNACPECRGIKENGAELSKEQIDKIISNLAEIENEGVILSGGGEPLISPYFSYAVCELRKRGIKIGLNSNGLALDEEKTNLILDNCEYFRISLDAATPEMYKKTHGMPQKAFEKVVENCRRFAKMKKEQNKNTSFGLGFLTSKDTVCELEQFVALGKETGADFTQFRPFVGDFTDITDQYLALKEKYSTDTFFVKASLQKYREMSAGNSPLPCEPKTANENTRPYSHCRGMFFSTVITADAKVFACLHYRQQPEYFLGDLNEKSLVDIFRSARMREVYESIDCSKCPPLCRDDVFNRVLHTLAVDVTHKEFL